MKKWFFRSMLAVTVGVYLMSGRAGSTARAAGQAGNTEAAYSYDALGRVSKVAYPDGMVILYTYDANGNLLEVKKTTSEKEEQREETKNVGRTQLPVVYSGYRPLSLQNARSMVLNLSYTEKDVKSYNSFKKKMPKIKSLKCKVSKKKYSLSIKIQQVNPLGGYGETGYEIRYSSSSKFKKSKKVTVSRKKKGKDTSKAWNVTKGKTYYVKVRAYMKMVTGKKIYTKYSKVKKIKAVK